MILIIIMGYNLPHYQGDNNIITGYNIINHNTERYNEQGRVRLSCLHFQDKFWFFPAL